MRFRHALASKLRTTLLATILPCTTIPLHADAQRARSSPPSRTYCNPLDVDYRYNYEQINEGISYRSGADPVIVPHRGAYYLFATLAAGYWRSTDLATWTHVSPSRWPLQDMVAPAALGFGDTIVIKPATFDVGSILYTTAPASGRVEFYNRLLPPLPDYSGDSLPGRPGAAGPWDPAFFRDDDGRWFLYWGSSNVYPLFGLELDPRTRLTYVGRPAPLLRLDPAAHGWERFGEDHRDTSIAPYVEGAWMTKHGGRYYLQYGAPGTEHNVYATGAYVGANPLGPFTYGPWNPVAYKPGGFVVGAGHGNTFQDFGGRWWMTGTPWIGRNWNFERRIALFPAAFDRDGQMHASTRFGDFPHRVAGAPDERPERLFTGWMLLSYRKRAVASSARDSFPASNVTDENPRTIWVAGANRAGETLTLDLGRAYTLRALQVNFADYRSGRYGTDSVYPARFRLRVSSDGRVWHTAADLSRSTRDRPNAYVELPTPVRARWVRYEHVHVGAANLAISDLRVFGNRDDGALTSATPADVGARRGTDARNAVVSWAPVAGAVGYNVRWGIAPDRLYETYQRWADQGPSVELRALTVGQRYWVAVESFDEQGVSVLSPPVGVQ
jgi:xylan 1,4-beta-xylosidase